MLDAGHILDRLVHSALELKLDEKEASKKE